MNTWTDKQALEYARLLSDLAREMRVPRPRGWDEDPLADETLERCWHLETLEWGKAHKADPRAANDQQYRSKIDRYWVHHRVALIYREMATVKVSRFVTSPEEEITSFRRRLETRRP